MFKILNCILFPRKRKKNPKKDPFFLITNLLTINNLIIIKMDFFIVINIVFILKIIFKLFLKMFHCKVLKIIEHKKIKTIQLFLAIKIYNFQSIISEWLF